MLWGARTWQLRQAFVIDILRLQELRHMRPAAARVQVRNRVVVRLRPLLRDQ